MQHDGLIMIHQRWRHVEIEVLDEDLNLILTSLASFSVAAFCSSMTRSLRSICAPLPSVLMTTTATAAAVVSIFMADVITSRLRAL